MERFKTCLKHTPGILVNISAAASCRSFHHISNSPFSIFQRCTLNSLPYARDKLDVTQAFAAAVLPAGGSLNRRWAHWGYRRTRSATERQFCGFTRNAELVLRDSVSQRGRKKTTRNIRPPPPVEPFKAGEVSHCFHQILTVTLECQRRNRDC